VKKYGAKKLLAYEGDYRKSSFLCYYTIGHDHRFELVDWFDSGIIVRYIINLIREPPFLVYIYVVILSFKGGEVYEHRKEFVLRRTYDSKFYEILDRLRKIKSISEYRELYRDLIFRMFY
jgi:hypothetical protein